MSLFKVTVSFLQTFEVYVEAPEAHDADYFVSNSENIPVIGKRLGSPAYGDVVKVEAVLAAPEGYKRQMVEPPAPRGRRRS